MRNKKGIKILLFACLMLLLTACGSTNTEENEENDTATNDTSTEETVEAVYVTPEVEDGKIAIDTDALSEHATYVNYNSDATNIQMIAVNASDGTPRLSLNTCQACNPSPEAYFKEENGRLVCQNCQNVFTMDSVGETAGGCNPMNIDYKVEDKKLIVNAADLDDYAEKFTSWGGPVE